MTRAIPFSMLLSAAALAVAAPVPKEDDAARMVRIYGTRADPKDDATYKMVRDALQITSPARKLPRTERDWEGFPTPEQLALFYWEPTAAGASRLWHEVAGDFTATVRVSFRIRPLIPRDHHWRTRVAGLFAWSGDKDHAAVIRCEEEVPVGVPGLPGLAPQRECFKQLLSWDEHLRTAHRLLPGSADAAYLRMVRKGNLVTGAYSRDGKDWTEFLPDEVEWKGNVKAGVYAKHFTDTPFTVTFDEYTLTTPKK